MKFEELATAYEICSNLRTELEKQMNETGCSCEQLYDLKDEIANQEQNLLEQMDRMRSNTL